MRLIFTAVVLSACAAEATPAGGDPPVDLLDPDHIVEVEIELAPADWQTLRAQTRSWVDVYSSCLRAPFASPFTYFPATVTIDGHRIERAGVRKKGFLGSLSIDKPSLKIALDEYVAGQELSGTTVLLLNNATQDPSYVRQCLTYGTFTAAGLPAPRCDFAHVRVDGEDLGLYVHVEKIDEAFLARHFDDPGGNLYEGTYSDFRDGWTATFEPETDRTTSDRSDIDAVVAALARPDEELVGAVDGVVDVERFLTFWAMEVLVTHRDGYTSNSNNYFAYHDPGSDRFALVPWGADGTFLTGPDPLDSGVVSVAAGASLSWRFYRLPEVRDRYLARLRELLDTVWDEDALEAEIDRMQALITPIADPDGAAGLTESIDEVRGVVRGRRAAILAELEAGPPAWERPLPDPPCLHEIGDLSGSLSTRWGTTGSDSFTSGTGTFAATVDTVPLEAVDVGSTAGWNPGDASRARVTVMATLADGTTAILVLLIDPALLRPGATLPIDWIAVKGTLFRYAPDGGGLTFLGLVAGGAVEIDEATITDGATVRATFHAPVVSSPF